MCVSMSLGGAHCLVSDSGLQSHFERSYLFSFVLGSCTRYFGGGYNFLEHHLDMETQKKG